MNLYENIILQLCPDIHEHASKTDTEENTNALRKPCCKLYCSILRFCMNCIQFLSLSTCRGRSLTVRQMALLGFRDLVLMQLSLGDLLQKNLSLVPASITQMLLVLQVNVTTNPWLICSSIPIVSWLFLCICREFRNPDAPQRNIANSSVWWH